MWRKLWPGLVASFLAIGVALGANNFLIQQPNGQWAIIKSTDDGTGAQQPNMIGGVAQGLASAGQLESLVACNVLSAPATYASGNSNPCVLNPAGQLLVNTEGQKATYRFSAGGHTTFGASTTDVLVIGGSASKVVRIGKISVCGTATAATTIDVILAKRSTADTGGTPVAITAAPLDSANAAATATVSNYTANPTTGTPVGVIDFKKLNLGTTGGGGSCLYWQFGDTNGQMLTLRAVAQQVAMNLNGVTAPAGTNLDYAVELTEE